MCLFMNTTDCAYMQERENRELNFTDVDLGEMVGGGGCGTVFRGNWKHHDGPVAIKEFQAGGKRHFETEV